MKRYTFFNSLFVIVVLACLVTACVFAASSDQAQSQIRLIVRADDIGSAHAANIACIKSYTEGVARSVEVMVPAPWFNEAVKMLNENPTYDVGVHLTLTSEWENVKWGPVTHGLSFVDEQGHFFANNSGFLEAKWKIDEVEKELRAQIELAKSKIKNVTHLSSHMGTPTCSPELRELVNKLSEEYKLPIGTPGGKGAPGWGNSNMTPEQREQALIEMLEKLGPGTWMIVEHPGQDCPEMRGMGHKGYWNVATHREGVTRAFTSDKVKKVIERRGIKLMSYSDLWEEIRKEN